MPGPYEDDELVMGLVESALDRPPQQREQFLRSVCGDSLLHAEVLSRVEWEERMGKFLLEPLPLSEILDHPFETGTRVAGRFRIVREVAFGGMGVVYEAVDEKLDRRVAIKCAKLGFGNRLPREVQAAREVSHFNVCKVHDLHVTETPSGHVEFLSMEYIDGETLYERVRRKGPVPAAEAKGIALQVCAGLSQAHRQGVIHGDLKPGNIILTGSPEGGLRAVITDFGLAKLKLADSSGASMSSGGGTLDYMAPELFLGARASVASDLYALGVLFHFMLAGRTPRYIDPSGVPPPPAPDTSSQDSTVTMGHAVAEAEWQREIGALPKPWGPVVIRCLAPRPDKRFRSGQEVSDALRARPSLFKWAAAAVLALAAIVTLLFLQLRETAVGRPVRLAILPFSVDGPAVPGAAGIAHDVADRLSGLRHGLLAISPAEALRNRVDTPEKARSTLGATHALATRVRGSGGQILVMASLVDTGSGHAIRDLKGVYAAGDTAVIAKALLATVTGAFRLRAGLALESVSPLAYPYYVLGTAFIRRDDQSADEAIRNFTRAIELDPRSALPYAGLAEAQMQKFRKGDGRQWLDLAGDAVAKAKAINNDSAPVLLISGLLQQEHGWYEQAVREFSRAAELDPGNSEVWRRLAVAYEQTNRLDEAAATYRKAMAVQPDYYRHYLDFGNFYLFRGRFRDAEALYRRTTAAAPSLATGHMNLGLALMQQGRFREAEDSLLYALRLNRTSRLLMNIGALYYAQERYEEALQYFRESLSPGPASAVRYKNLGDAYRHLGRAQEAAAAYDTARTIAEDEVARNPRRSLARAQLGLVSAHLGDLRRAEFELAQALALDPGNSLVLREAVVGYEVLRQRERTLAALQSAPVYLLQELSRQPDVKDLRQDPRFIQLLKQNPSE